MAARSHGARPAPAPPLRRAQPRPGAALHRPRAGGRRRSAEPGARLSRGRGAEVLAARPRLPGPLPDPRALRVSAAGERGGERAVRAVARARARAGAEQRGVAGHRAAARRLVIWQPSLCSAEHVCPLFSALFSTQTRYVERIPGIVF